MSVKLRIRDISDQHKKLIEKTLHLTCDLEDVEIYEIVKDSDVKYILLPFNFARSVSNIITPSITFSDDDHFIGTLRPQQFTVRNVGIKSIEETGSIIISAEPGFGKTITAIKMICDINVPTVIFINQALIMDQWKRAIMEHAPKKKVFNIKSNKPIDPNADIYLVNPVILKKPSTINFFHIKLLVVDELHKIVTRILHRAFFKFQPSYVIGLSATPYRPKSDPFEPAISWFFGNNVVGKKLYRKHTVYCVKTDFTPSILMRNGQLDWATVLTSQSQDLKRNNIIVNSVLKFPERTWLILVKRIEHATILQNLFKESGAVSETIVGNSRGFDKTSKILIGTTPKIGVGFDHAPIDGLCIAADVLEYFEQFLGRCMRRQDSEPIIIDFEDKFYPLVKHLKSRIQKYKECGGIIYTNVLDIGNTVGNTVGNTEGITEVMPKPTIKLRKKTKI